MYRTQVRACVCLCQVVYEKLIAAKLAGKPFVGAIFWEAVVDGQTVSFA